MKNEITAKDKFLNESVKKFNELFVMGVEAFQEAATIYVTLIDRYPEQADEFRNSCPAIKSNQIWADFERLGRRQMLPEFLFVSGRAGQNLRRLPISEQKNIINGIDYLIDGSDTLKVKPDAITPEIAKQVFAADGSIRTVAQQKAWKLSACAAKQASSKLEQAPAAVKNSIRYQDGKVIMSGVFELKTEDILGILQKMVK